MRIVFLIITVGGVFGLIFLFSQKDRMTPSVKKRLTSFLVSLAAMFAPIIASGLSGWGPCGPGSAVARFFFYAAVAAFFISIITGVILIVASIRGRLTRLSELPRSTSNEGKTKQDGTGQPATRPVDEPEGGVKPQPEAEGALPVAGCQASTLSKCMKHLKLALPLAIISLCTSGCIVPVPGTECVAPRISGTVVDAVTKKPIPGASVMWTMKPDTRVETDNVGHFTIREFQDVYLLRIYSPGGEQHVPEIHPATQIEAAHPKYKTAALGLTELLDKQYRLTNTPKIIKLRPN